MNVARMIDAGMSLESMEAELRRRAAWEALCREKNHAGRAARRLGIHRNTFTRLLAATSIPGKPVRRQIFAGRKVGKKAAGALLNGVEHHAFPGIACSGGKA